MRKHIRKIMVALAFIFIIPITAAAQIPTWCEISLPDSEIITINAGGSINYKCNWGGGSGTYYGYFDIEKDKFTINGTYKSQTYYACYADPNKAYINHLMIMSGSSSNDYYQYAIVKSNY